MESFEDESERLLCDLDTFVTRRTTYGTGHRSLEAARKRCNLGDESEEFDGTGWLHKPIAEWRQEEAIHWLMSAYWNMGQLYRSIPDSLILSGKQLLGLSKEDFEAHDRVYGGRLYDELHSKQTPISLPSIDTIYPFPEPPYARLEPPIDIDRESHSSVEEPPKRRKPRPPGPKNHTGKLWEFIRDLLQNRDTCPSLICWEDYSQAKFRFVKSDEVAKRWGSRKGNKKMTYEKLSRAMRYYYKSSIFLPVLGRRLVYQFGPNAKGWQTDNPNFRH